MDKENKMKSDSCVTLNDSGKRRSCISPMGYNAFNYESLYQRNQKILEEVDIGESIIFTREDEPKSYKNTHHNSISASKSIMDNDSNYTSSISLNTLKPSYFNIQNPKDPKPIVENDSEETVKNCFESEKGRNTSTLPLCPSTKYTIQPKVKTTDKQSQTES